MSDDWENYVNDPRTICKYGIKCYQKNVEHHAKYKHLPAHYLQKHQGNRKKQRFSPYNRNRDSKSPTTDAVTASTSAVDAGILDNSETESNLEQHTSTNNKLDKDKFSVEPEIQDAKQSVQLPKDISYFSESDTDMLKELFLVEMPQDFFSFYEYLNKNNDIERLLGTVNLELIGPYDLLMGRLPKLDEKELYLVHWRYYYDPPEFQSVLKRKGKSEYHIGYFRDDPKDKPVFLASNDSAKDCRLTPMASNIFGAVYLYLQDEKKRSVFSAQPCKKLEDQIRAYAEEHNISLKPFTMKERQRKIVTKTLHGAGIVVPVQKKTELGYRKLVENDAAIKNLFAKLKSAKTQSEKDAVLSELQPVITYASIAVDECDFGTGVEVGIDLFCSGLKELEPSALSSLTAAYPLLDREPFSKIIQAHLKHRRKGPDMSLLSLNNS